MSTRETNMSTARSNIETRLDALEDQSLNYYSMVRTFCKIQSSHVFLVVFSSAKWPFCPFSGRSLSSFLTSVGWLIAWHFGGNKVPCWIRVLFLFFSVGLSTGNYVMPSFISTYCTLGNSSLPLPSLFGSLGALNGANICRTPPAYPSHFNSHLAPQLHLLQCSSFQMVRHNAI